MRNAMKVVLVMAMVAVVAGSASAAIVIDETFDTDPTARGWIADGPAWHSSGGNPGGYYSGTRSGFYPWVGMATGGMNIPETYGATVFNASIDAIWISGTSAGISWDIYSGSTVWKYDFNMVPPTSWTNYSIENIDTEWSDVDAAANGWTRTGGSGSFSSIWDATDYILFTQVVGGGAGGTISVGVDNFILETVPEPTTMGLLLAGGIAAVLKRRRK